MCVCVCRLAIGRCEARVTKNVIKLKGLINEQLDY